MDSELLSDDLHPNNSPGLFQPEPPKEQQQEIAAERNMVMAAAPFIDVILEWFDEQTALLNTLEGLNESQDLATQIHGRKLAVELLQDAKGNLSAMRDSYLKNQN